MQTKNQKSQNTPSENKSLPIGEREHSSISNLLGLAIIILLGTIIYSNSFNCSFHFDDFNNFANKTNIPQLTDFKTWWHFNQSRLIAFYSFALNIHFNHFNVWGYHLVNLIIHLINSGLVWWLTVLIFSSPAMKDHPISKNKQTVAFIAALLFVSHPLATQSVTYIIQRMASLVTLFYLLSIALYAKGRLMDHGNKYKYFLFMGSLLSAGLAMLTKENAFTLPFAILLFEFFFIQTKKFSVNFKDYRLILVSLGIIGFIILIALKFSFSIFNPILPSQGISYTITPMNYLLTQFSVLIKYIQLLFLPINQMLEYDFPISNNFFEPRTISSFLILAALIFSSIYFFNKNRIISFGILFFFLSISVESSIIPIRDLIFEHRTYLPSLGFFLILSSGLFALLREKYKFLTITIFVVIIGSNSYLTYQRNKIWKDEQSLWSDNIKKAPNLARPYNNRGANYYNMGQLEKALVDYSKAIEIDPYYADAHYNAGVIHGIQKQWDKAVNDYTNAINNKSNYVKAYSNRGSAYAAILQWDKAMADYAEAIQLDPGYVNSYFNRGNAFRILNEWEKAIADYNLALEIDPNYTIAQTNREFASKNLKNDINH